MSDAPAIRIRLVSSIDGFDGLLDHPLLKGAGTRQQVVTRYFDRPDWTLHKARASWRTRTIAASHEQVFARAPDDAVGPLESIEWSSRIAGNTPHPEALPMEARESAARLTGGAALEAFAKIESERVRRTLDHDGATIGAIFDRGEVVVDGRRDQFCELVLELQQGTSADLLRFALELPLGPRLHWSTEGRAERAYHLATQTEAGASKATPVRLDRALSATAAFRRIAWHGLEQLLHNYVLVLRRRDADALHQSRVALRRLRALFSIYAPILADDGWGVLKAELQAVAVALGSARDLDVLIRTLESQDAPADVDQEDVDRLLLQLDRQRSGAYERVGGLLGSASFQKLLFGTAAWVEDGDWLSRLSDEARAMPVVEFASQVLRRRRKQVEKAARRLATCGPGKRHRLRIKVKKLRYTSDFFASLFTSRRLLFRQQAFSAALEKLQDRLGELNDMAASRDLVAIDPASMDEIERAGLLSVLQRMIGARADSEHRLLKAAEKAGNEAMLVRRFWKKAGR
jgi:inorganic triphosphatase YgiF